ncbi:FAD:protein FMN transferase [Pelistega europaea]|uniref:FAD:protein FMN transferase n=1 Tax=Pelistega europaea TaxID=106147 RepID=A0A7Y4LCC4_9BURK|nr:FAD:protein FMN transferase [Pelistega europaea]NOL49676.1 FAD:protein FMN transferase [Pelistega europaea]
MVYLTGETMGSSWNVHIAQEVAQVAKERIQSMIEMVLEEVNQQMSPFIPQSEISLFNDNPSTAPIALSPAMYYVVRQALTLCEQTDGVYDITVEPLVNIWGFGAKEVKSHPDDAQVADTLRYVNYRYLSLTEEGLRKEYPQTRIDLCSIAKGYGVDKVAEVLEKEGIHHYLVEIGGELRLSGSRYDQAWRVGVERPQWGGGVYEHMLTFKEVTIGVATSGNYRNYFKDKEKVASHEINTQTGYTKVSEILSVTVLAENCMLADGYATALFLLGEKAIEFAEKQQIAALFIVNDDSHEKGYALRISSAFARFINAK